MEKILNEAPASWLSNLCLGPKFAYDYSSADYVGVSEIQFGMSMSCCSLCVPHDGKLGGKYLTGLDDRERRGK